MLVTCVMASHDKPDLCHEAVQSVVGQAHREWELILVDSGVLYDRGYFSPWSGDGRVRVIRSGEDAETRRTKAMAPWCFNECHRKGLIRGEIVVYLCDDDLYYPNAFAAFDAFFRANPEAMAVYASQDIGVIRPDGRRAVVGERRAAGPGGRCCRGRLMDCVVDYCQMAIWRGMLDLVEWPEGKDTETHADGVLMEKIGLFTPFHPLDVKVSQNRRAPSSTYGPSR